MIPESTIAWLREDDVPAVSVLASRLLGVPEPDGAWGRRNEYGPVARILEAQHDDGSWDVPQRDYQKYRGSLWQLVFLGELWADGADERVRRGAEYAFSRQLSDGAWSCNGKPAAAIPCLTANVGRSIARLGYCRDERVVRALEFCVRQLHEAGVLDCGSIYSSKLSGPKGGGARVYTLNGYCHMLAPKTLLFLAEVPRELWPNGAEELRDECVRVLRDKQVFRSLPAEYREFQDLAYSAKAPERPALRERFLAEHGAPHYGDKPGWLRFGFPLSYNSDALEALLALAAHGEAPLPEYGPALDAVEAAADADMHWAMRSSLNGKMIADVERKGAPSKWVTLRALTALRHFGRA